VHAAAEVEPAGLTVPPGQLAHTDDDDAPDAAEYVLAGQEVHPVLCDVAPGLEP